MKSENSVGPRTDPCGTPWVILCISASFTAGYCHCASFSVARHHLWSIGAFRVTKRNLRLLNIINCH